MEKGKIQFKPLHEGMGFHPFSDGLPYAPESKAKPSQGTGATAAGKPRFTTQIQNIQSATSRQALKTARQLNASPQVQSPVPQPVQTQKPQAQTAPRIQMTREPESPLVRARFFAYLLDAVLHAAFWLGTNFAALHFFKFQMDMEIVKENS